VMVWIPEGEFVMGSKNAREPYLDEKPQRTVYLSGYWMYKYPVTVKQFRKFTLERPYRFDWERLKPEEDWQDDHPMVHVSWHDAKAYCEWAQVSLPTEAQWEKAARGTDGRLYPWGNTYDPTKLWWGVNTGTASVYRRTNVSESPYGCVDMAGNVWQWCRDWYDGDYYKTAPQGDPEGPNSGTYRVLRGGSWIDTSTKFIRVMNRYSFLPTASSSDRGFRASSAIP
jgi:formylglycine-generating enzyme